ncbi:unnamed protein product [Pocillopora meandrina]|uniref:Uncharacterized protein n=1 Tax=Pocillopora meandrina TaxID=46732 RepID=A0AAU9XRJ7_9CNID|nr:unnamed protein product [Pocillopora meandrina]
MIDSYEKEIIMLKGKVFIMTQVHLIDNRNEKTKLVDELASCQQELGRRRTPTDLLKPEPPRDGTPRKSNPARHRRHRTVPPFSLSERKVETKDHATQVSSSECNSRPIADQILCFPYGMVVNVYLPIPTHSHAILTAAAFPPIQISGTASVSTED